MPAFSLIFNKLQVEVPAKTILLSVESSVSLQCPSKDTRHMKTKHLLELLCSGNVWVPHGNGCRIDFCILLDGQMDAEPGMEKIVADVAASIQETQLWSQVSLNAKLEIPHEGTSNSLQSSFSIILRHSPCEKISARSRMSLSSVPPDVQLPTCVPCFQLRRIKIVMTFGSGRVCQEARHSLPYVDSFDTHASDPYPHAPLCQDHEMLDGSTLLYKMDTAASLLTTRNLTKHVSALPSPPNSQGEEMSKTESDRVRSSITMGLGCAREMAHLALIKLIGGRQSKSQTGIKVVLRRPTLTLSKLAPSLFTPGFAEATSQRSQFIPTISHTLSVSLMRNAQSPSLRRKLLSLASNHSSPLVTGVNVDPVNDIDDQPGHLKSQTSRTLGYSIEGRLWGMMQRCLNYPLPALHASFPEDVSTSMDAGTTVGLGTIPTNEPEEAAHIARESLSFMGRGQGFLEDDFEDLFENLRNKREHEGLETLVRHRMNEGGVDDDFMDLFEDETTLGTGELGARFEEYDNDFDIVTDNSIKCWEYSENIGTSNPWDEHAAHKHDILDTENEEMLV